MLALILSFSKLSLDSSSEISFLNWSSFCFFNYLMFSSSFSLSCIRSISSRLFSSSCWKICMSSFGSLKFNGRSSSSSSMIYLSSGGILSSLSSCSLIVALSNPCWDLLKFFPDAPNPLPWPVLFYWLPLPPVWFILLASSFYLVFYSIFFCLIFNIRSISSRSSLEAWTEGKLSKNYLKLLYTSKDSTFFVMLLTRMAISSTMALCSLVFSFFYLLRLSSSFCASWVFSLSSLKNTKKAFVSVSSIFSEHVRPSSCIVACSANLSISSYFVSSIYCTKNISRFFSMSYQRFSLFFGLSMGIVKPAASATLTLL